MTKDQLITLLSYKYNQLPANVIKSVVDIIVNEMSASIIKREPIEIREFGTFIPRTRKAQITRNPKTKKLMKINEIFYSHYKVSKKLIESLNN